MFVHQTMSIFKIKYINDFKVFKYIANFNNNNKVH